MRRATPLNNQLQKFKKRNGEPLWAQDASVENAITLREYQKSDVIVLMTSEQGHPKRELQPHVLGSLSVYAMASAARATQHWFNFKILGTVVCNAVFMEVYAISNVVIKNNKRLLNPTVLHASEGEQKAWISVHPGLVVYCEKDIEQHINLEPGQNYP